MATKDNNRVNVDLSGRLSANDKKQDPSIPAQEIRSREQNRAIFEKNLIALKALDND